MLSVFLFGLFFLGLGQFVADINLVVKILALLFIVGFARQHVGEGLLATVIVIVIAYFVLFVNWWFFGSIFIAYLLLMAGISGILVDFFFVSGQFGGAAQAEEQMKAQQEMAEAESRRQQEAMLSEGEQAIRHRPDTYGIDVMERAHKATSLQHKVRDAAAHMAAKVAARPRPRPPMGG